jgi:hypothetical protein
MLQYLPKLMHTVGLHKQLVYTNMKFSCAMTLRSSS